MKRASRLAKRLIGVAFLVAIACAFVLHRSKATPQAAQTNASATLNDVLWWLPQDTETLLVSQGAFKLQAEDFADAKPREQIKPATARDLQNFHWSFSTMQAAGFAKELQDQTILLSIEGSRKPIPPKGLGMTPYEGCAVLVMKKNARKPLAAVVNALSKKAKSRINVAGQRVLVFEKKQEHDIWKRYVTSPSENVLLVATNRAYLESVLVRMKQKRNVRALPALLPLWKFVDQNAQYWAVRDVRSKAAKRAFANDFGDNDVIGLTMSLDTKKSRKAFIRYLSKSPNALSRMRQTWVNPVEGINGQVKKRGESEVQIVVDFDQKGQHLSIFIFYTLGFFGHAIYL